MRKKLELLLFIFFCLPNTIYADNINIVCPSSVEIGSEFTCQINGDSTSNVTSLSTKIKLSNGLSFISFKKNDNWLGDGDDGYITLYGSDGNTGKFNIGLLKLKYNANNTNTINLDQVFFFKENGDEISVSSISKTIELKVNNSEKENNKSNTTNNSTTISNNTNNNTSNNISNNTSNNSSSNQIIDSNKSDKTVDTKTDNNKYINNIIIENYHIDFNKYIYDYKLQINNEDKLIINPVVDDDVKYEITGNENLKDGSIIKIKVLSNTNINKVYRILINKKEEDNKNISNNKNIFLIIIIIVLIIINAVRFFISRNKKKDI